MKAGNKRNMGATLKRLIAYILKEYKWQCLLVALCILVSTVANIGGTLFMRNLIDDYILPFVNQTRPDLSPQKVINQTSGIAIIPGEPGKVFHHNAVDFPAHHIPQEPLESFALRIGSRVAVIYILGVAFKFFRMVEVKIIENVALVFHAVAVVKPPVDFL
jgi:ABC-type multidrug transport system fused ATPase/permease subunit